MKILVTGATGGLGRNAVDYLLHKSIDVVATGRNEIVGADLKKAGAAFVPLNLVTASQYQLEKIIAGVDAVWHCAALSSPWGSKQLFQDCNVKATKSLITASGLSGVKSFVHVSTPAIYFDYQHRYGVPESFKAGTFANEYARSKYVAETEVQKAKTSYTQTKFSIIRPRAIFGPYDQVLLPRLLAILRQRKGVLPLPRGGQVLLDMTYVENIAHAMWLATLPNNAESGEAFNITNKSPALLAPTLLKLINESMNIPCAIKSVPYPILAGVSKGMEVVSNITRKEPSLTPYSVGVLAYDMTLDVTKAASKLGYEPIVTLEDGIVKTAEWFRNNGFN